MSYLCDGGISTITSTTSRRGSQNTAASLSSAAVDNVVRWQTKIQKRRQELQLQTVDSNTCPECHEVFDEYDGSTWVACDREEGCLSGGGWYHVNCTDLNCIEIPEGGWLCKLCIEDSTDEQALEDFIAASATSTASTIEREVVVRTIETTVATLLSNCTVVKGEILFLKSFAYIAPEFVILDIQLHDCISDVYLCVVDEWELIEGGVEELTDEELGYDIRFTLARKQSRNVDIAARDVLSESNNRYKVGCARDTYEEKSYLPRWLSGDTARPPDVQNPCRRFETKKRKQQALNRATKCALTVVSQEQSEL